METVIPLDRFHNISAKLRQRIPMHDEFPERISEDDARSCLHRIPKPDTMDYTRFEAEMSFSDLALFCRMLCLPEADAFRELWEPIIMLRSGKTLYLQLRSMLQFHQDNQTLRDVFVFAASEIQKKQSNRTKILSLLKTEQDDLLELTVGEYPLEHMLGRLMQSKAPVGVYAVEQSLIRHAPLFNRLRERYFQICPADGFYPNSRELLQCMDSGVDLDARGSMGVRVGADAGADAGADVDADADVDAGAASLNDVKLVILAHYLDLHTVKTFPHDLTRQLVNRFGYPDDSDVWRRAETLRNKNTPGHATRSIGKEGKSASQKSGSVEMEAPHQSDIAGMRSPKKSDALNGLPGLAYWFRLEMMKEHFGEGSLKMEVFSRYMPQLDKVTLDPAHEAILLHFTNVTVIDFTSVTHFSWVCDAAEFEIRYESMVKAMLEQGDQGEREPGLRKRRKIPEAKDFIIEQENGAAIRLTFAEVGKLYAFDLLSIRLGLMERETWGVM